MATLYFYDTETSGINPRSQRVLQFAGQRTDLELNPIGKPHNVLIKLTDEIIPEPEAIAVHGILPQETLKKGLSEADFVKFFYREVLEPDTTIVGFNNIRFDDEFIRHIMWRNMYDAYEWHWQDGRTRWDMLDVSRLIRVLRPDGVNWPVDEKGKPTNKLVSLTEANNLSHLDAHDALSDVNATIALAKLLRSAQPKIFDWLYKNRDKNSLAQFVNLENPQPFIYSSGRYSSDNLKTTLAFPVAPVKESSSLLVYDLRYNPEEFMNLSLDQLKARMTYTKDKDKDKETRSLPVKKIALNRCPAVAPISVFNEEIAERINLTLATGEEHAKVLEQNKSFGDMLRTIFEEKAWPEGPNDVDFQLYQGTESFISSADKSLMDKLHQDEPDSLLGRQPEFVDERLDKMLLRFKARNYPEILDIKEQTLWQSYRKDRLNKGLPGQPNFTEFKERVEKIRPKLGDKSTNLLIDYVEGLKPYDPTLI